ncbi:MAG TPA: hypothetical protein VGY13_14290 [Solirubrobacteraceae bacterium]|jgi:hypothetical protein|nr:hypothetical protein [Solirubrobacteraceae bacterium]
MLSSGPHLSSPARAERRAALGCALALLALAPAAAVGDTAGGAGATLQPGASSTGQGGTGTATSPKTPALATLEQCATATAPQTERSATISGEMTAVPGTARMQLRIQLEERAGSALRYRAVTAPGLGAWRSSAPGVKVFAHIQQFTNLSAPAFYRGLVSFRWVDAAGHTIKVAQLHSASCEQPAASTPAGSTPGSAATA